MSLRENISIEQFAAYVATGKNLHVPTHHIASQKNSFKNIWMEETVSASNVFHLL